MPRTKIVATIGPASESEEILADLVQSNMSVARLNFSHGTHQEHAQKIRRIRQVSEKLGRPVAILQDLAGPKIRIGDLPKDGVMLLPGASFRLHSEPGYGGNKGVSVSYSDLPAEVEPGDRILLADGVLELEVVSCHKDRIDCKVVIGGMLTSHKGINLPTRTIHTPVLTEKDKKDLAFGLANNVDYVAISFVRSAEDIRQVAGEMKGASVPLIAKIEKHEAVNNIDEILAEADGIMVARGDLGVEIPYEDVPGFQKILIRKANAAGKPVITATQMLRSMVAAPRPTRAEATDVANAVLDGTDAVMLSEETASGDYPVEALAAMSKIARKAEETCCEDSTLKRTPSNNVAECVAHASCVLASQLSARAVVASTASGLTARQISRFRPPCPILALSSDPKTVRALTLFWGCIPMLVKTPMSTDDLIESTGHFVLQSGLVKKGDIVVITAGHPLGGAGTTNMLRVKEL